jgi:hypothetical protein
MNATVNAVTATNTNDDVLDGLLADLGGDATIETVLANDAAAGVPGAANLLADIGNLDDVLESIDNGDSGAINVKSADITVDPVDEIIEAAAADAPVVEAPAVTPAKKGSKKAGTKKGKKATSVPAGYGSDSEEEKKDTGTIEAKTDDAPTDLPEPAAAAPEVKPAKPLRPTSVTHKPGDLLVAKLGSDDAAALLVFDDRHDGEQIQAAHADFIARMNITDSKSEHYIADKVRDKAVMLFTWLAKGGALNEVMRRTFTVLHRDQQITGGMKGNLHLELLAKPYSQGTAASQGNQMFMLLPLLGICLKEKGRMVPNPHSPLLAMINATLGLK